MTPTSRTIGSLATSRKAFVTLIGIIAAIGVGVLAKHGYIDAAKSTELTGSITALIGFLVFGIAKEDAAQSNADASTATAKTVGDAIVALSKAPPALVAAPVMPPIPAADPVPVVIADPDKPPA